MGETCSQESFARWEAIAGSGIPLDATDEAHQNVLRFALLDFIADFANWDNSTVPEYLQTSRALTQVSHEGLGGLPGTKPVVVDPFAGGGAFPIEAARVGTSSFAGDLNPLAATLNKVLLVFAPKFGHTLTNQVKKYGQLLQQEIARRLTPYYPHDANNKTVICYFWARTVHCEGPACGVEVPIIRSFQFAKRAGNEAAVEVTYEGKRLKTYLVLGSKAKAISGGTSRRSSVTCPKCGYPAAFAETLGANYS